jgi:FkbM family methyltransferase
MKHIINNLLKPFHAEIHGTGYLKKLQKGTNAPDAIEAQARLLDHNARVIFDIGANRGEVSKRYSQAFPGSSIHAFEPFEEFHADFLRENPASPGIILNKLALSDKEGTADFYLNASSDTNSLLEPVTIGASSDKSCRNIGTHKVETSTLNKYCAGHRIQAIDILKMDTQGSELSILKGADELLKGQHIKLIYTEAYFKPQYKDQPLLYDIANYLKDFGYFLEGIYDPYYNERLMLWCDAIFLPVTVNGQG